MNKKLILIDGFSLIYRMFYGVREMSNSKGIPTNALYGFVNTLYKIQKDYQPDYFAIALDLPTPTFRHEMDSEYKGGRDLMPEDLQTQVEILQKLFGAMNISVLTKEGFEADDIIGTLAKRAEADGVKTQVITGDKDMFQLVDKEINILYTATRSGDQFATVDEAYVDERYGVTPKQLIDVKALMGDKSDNIPGIAGIGEKTALKLISAYGDLDGLYAHTDELKGKQQERIVNGKDDAYLSLKLGTIVCDVPLDYQPEDLKMGPFFTDEAIAMLTDLEMKSILKRVSDAPVESNGAVAADIQYTTVENTNGSIAAMNLVNRGKKLTLYVLSEGEKTAVAFLAGGVYHYLDKPAMVADFFAGIGDIPSADELATVGHDLKGLTHVYHDHGAVLVNYAFDVYIAAYLLSPADQRYDLSTLALKYLDEALPSEEEFFGKGKARKTLTDISKEELAAYMVKCVDVIKRLEKLFAADLAETGMADLNHNIELPLLPVMASMEEIGFTIDVDQLGELSDTFVEKMDALTAEIYELAGEDDFNINSTKQLGEVLFEKLKLPVVKKTKTGYSTNAEVLEELKNFHPIIQKILDYRTVSKLDSTYGKGLIKLVDPKTHKIYSTFNQTVAATGRLSSSDPNLQNIPVRTDIGREIRKVFVPSAPDRLLVDADYSQIELRVLAHLSGDENLIDAFVKEQDIHARTAAEIFDVPLEEVSREQRSHAKAINFGLIYGKQAFSLAKDLGISRGEAQKYIDTYFARYPKVSAYMAQIKETAKEQGYVTTIWGRRRYIPEINSRNRMLVQAGERMALNTPIQGSAADIIKLAMIAVYRRLEKEEAAADLILQVHDELIIDAPQAEAEAVAKLLAEEMQGVAELKVPLVVDVHTGKSWYEVK